MKVNKNPQTSELGIRTVVHEVVDNETGILAVSFRYTQDEMRFLQSGFQMQYETIKLGASRGAHYHYPEDAEESFYVIDGDCRLIVCDINQTICEIYDIEKGKTYTVPGMILHKAVNTSKESEVKMVVAKPFNFKVVNRTIKIDMSWTEKL